jgi:hypothetical protein
MDHVSINQHSIELRKSAGKAAKLRKIPVTRGTALAFVLAVAFLVWVGGTLLAGCVAYWLGAPGPVPYVVGLLTAVLLHQAAKNLFEVASLRIFLDSLGTFADLSRRSMRLHRVVEACVRLEEAAARFSLPDQLKTWGSLSALDDGIEDLVALHRQLWLEVRNPETCSGIMPEAVADYVDYAAGSFHQTMHPKALAASVQGFMDKFLESDSAPRWHARKLAEMGQMGFIESCPRFDIRSNIDWALANAWCISGHEHLAGGDYPRGDFMDEEERIKTFQDAYMSWWDSSRETRSNSLSFDRVLLCAPAVLFIVRAVSCEPKGRQYPISTGSFAVVDITDAPVEYVKKLWESSQGTSSLERRTLRTVVKAARLLGKSSRT